MVSTRVSKDIKKAIDDLAKQHGLTVSAEISLALKFWVKRHESSQLHNSHLAHTISVLANGIERLTGHSWMVHPLTRQMVREYVEQLVAGVLSPLAKPVTVPVEVKEEAGVLLALLIHATGARRFAGTVIVADPELVMLTNDLAQKWGTEANVETRPELVAWRKRDEEAWADAVRANTAVAFENYLKGRKVKKHIIEARNRLAALKKQGRRK